MKLILAILVTVCLQQGYAAYGQTITISKKNASISSVLKEIRAQTGYDFFFEDNSIDGAKKIDIRIINGSIEEVLASCFKGESLSYTISGNAIVIRQREETQQQRTITGQVSDENGNPLEGVTVRVNETNVVTTTDANGNYELSVPPGGEMRLVYSILGFETAELAVTSQTTVDVSLKTAISELDEAVVIGYGTSTRRDLTSSVANIDAGKLKNLPVASITDGLAGRAAGLIVTKSGGGIGEKSNISIRGGGTPLAVIDGIIVPYADFENLNPDDIESMSILKDAAATAVYGARAGDGILVIKTKSGGSGIQVNYSLNKNWSQPTFMPRKISSYELAMVTNKINTMYGLTAPYDSHALEAYRTGSDPYNFPNTDWQALTLREFAPETKHSFSLSSGYDQSEVYGNKLYASFQTFDQESMYKVKGSNYLKRRNVRINDEFTLKKIGLRLSLGLDGYIETDRFPLSQWSQSYWHTWSHIQNQGTMALAYNEFGQFYQGPDNPLVETSLESGYDKRENSVINGLFKAELDIPKVTGLTASVAGNYRLGFYDRKAWNKTALQYDLEGNVGPPAPMHLTYEKNKDYRYTMQYFLNYKNGFFDTHNVEATFGFENTYGFYTNTWLGRRSYLFEIDQIGAGPSSTMENGGGEGEFGRAGFVGSASYNYQRKYYLSGTFRYDGSDLFPEDKRWGMFYAGSLAYVISEEDFFSSLRDRNIINFLKFRFSYGETGLDSGVDRFSYLASYGYNERGYVVNGNLVPTFNEGALVSPDITWFTRNTSNIGVDFQLLSNRLSGSFEYFYHTTVGYLSSPSGIDYTDPLGLSLPTIKSDGVHRRAGYDVSLSWKDNLNDFSYEVGVNFTYFDQLVAKAWDEDLANQMNPYTREVQQTGYWGRALINKGLYRSADEILVYPRRDQSTGIAAGDIRYEDINGDGFIDGNDEVRVGSNGFPRGNYGVFLNTSYKGFFANVLFQGATSRDLNLELRGGLVYEYLHDFWTPDNRSSLYPRRTTGNFSNGDNNGQTSDFWLINAKYIRLKSLQIGYDFKNSLLKGVKFIKNSQLVLSGQNLITWSPTTKYEFDPETASTNNYGYPYQRVYALSFNIGF